MDSERQCLPEVERGRLYHDNYNDHYHKGNYNYCKDYYNNYKDNLSNFCFVNNSIRYYYSNNRRTACNFR